MFIKIKNIELKYENESVEPSGADVSYSLILNDSQLEGNITITSNDRFNNIGTWQLFQFNKHIFEKIMSSL